MPFTAVFFDFGGTLVDTPPQFDYEISLVQLHGSLLENRVSIAYEDYKKAHIEIRDRVYAKNAIREVSFGLRTCEALSRFGLTFQPADRVITEAIDAFMDPWIQARTMEKYVPSLLSSLSNDYKLGVVSNSAYSPAVRKTLERFDIARFFDVVVVSVDVGWRKPSSRIFQKALKTLEVPASESVFVGDELDHDVEGAKKVGMLTVWLNKAKATQATIKVQPDQTVHELKELPRALRALEAYGHCSE